MKIICVGWNYPDHNRELRAEMPQEPTVFMKPDSALLKSNKPFFIPEFSDEVHYETELVLRINRLGKNIAKKFAYRYYDEVGLGVDFTARDLQRRQKMVGGPWEICKSFDNSAAISNFLPINSLNKESIHFRLDINSKTVQCGDTADMLFGFDEIVEYVSRFFTLKIGDLIYTGTPAGVGEVKPDDVLEGYIEETRMFEFRVK